MNVKYNIESFKGKSFWDIVNILLDNPDYIDNPHKYYVFFGTQGGTIWQLVDNIINYNK